MHVEHYSHLVEVDEESRTISIHRVIDGRRQFYTSVSLPAGRYEDNLEQIQELFKLLGENLILDSPQGRRCLGL